MNQMINLPIQRHSLPRTIQFNYVQSHGDGLRSTADTRTGWKGRSISTSHTIKQWDWYNITIYVTRVQMNVSMKTLTIDELFALARGLLRVFASLLRHPAHIDGFIGFAIQTWSRTSFDKSKIVRGFGRLPARVRNSSAGLDAHWSRRSR